MCSLNLLNFVHSFLYDVGTAFQLPRIPITVSRAIRIWNFPCHLPTILVVVSAVVGKNFFSGKYPIFYQNQNVKVKLHFKCDSEIIDGLSQSIFSQNQGTFFSFQTRAGEASSSLPTSCVPAFSYLLHESSFLKNNKPLFSKVD